MKNTYEKFSFLEKLLVLGFKNTSFSKKSVDTKILYRVSYIISLVDRSLQLKINFFIGLF